jgi:hypothetical protein
MPGVGGELDTLVKHHMDGLWSDGACFVEVHSRSVARRWNSRDIARKRAQGAERSVPAFHPILERVHVISNIDAHVRASI